MLFFLLNKLNDKKVIKMKNKLLTISAITVLLIAGQSAIAEDGQNFTPFDAEAINQVTDARQNHVARTPSDADLMKASSLNSRIQEGNEYLNNESEDPFSLNFSHDE
jgi:hypothetical protein